MALKDILLSSKYPDDFQIALPDGTSMTVGEMRSLEADEKAKLMGRQQTLDQAEQTLAARIHEAAQRGILSAQPLPAEERRAVATEYGLDESDPLIGQVVKEMKRMREDGQKAMEAMQKTHAEEIKKVAGITAKVTQAYLGERYAQNYKSSIANLPADIAKKVSLEDAIKYAEQHKLMDDLGAYDISSAVDRLTWNDMKEHERAEVKKSAVADAQKAADLARILPGQRRSSAEPAKDAFSPTIKDGDRTRTKSLDEVLAEAANDQAFWASAALGLPN
jgi:hypothetical protein